MIFLTIFSTNFTSIFNYEDVKTGANDYGHPSDYAIKTLEASKYQIYRTDDALSSTAKNISDSLSLVSKSEQVKSKKLGRDISFDLNSKSVS